MRRMFVSFAAVLALLACNKDQRATPITEAGPAASTVSSPSSSSSTRPLGTWAVGTPGTPWKPPPDKCTLTAFNEGVSEGRKAFGEKRYRDAIEEFSKAVTARPLDAKARGELGYAMLNNGNLDGADEELRVGAELAVGDAKLAAQIWFNRGLVAEKRSQPEIARACFAVSDQLNSTGATKAKLKDKSKCPVAMERTNKGEPLMIVNGWKAVHAALMPRLMGGEDGQKEQARPAPTTEEEAKKRSCVNYALSAKQEGDPSKADAPWSIQTGHMMYRNFIVEVIPLPSNRFALVQLTRGGGGPASGNVHGRTELAGDRLLVVNTTGEAHFVVRETDCVTDPMDRALIDAGGIGYGDIRSLTSNDFTVYDTKTGNPVLVGVAWGEDASENLKLTPSELRVADKESTRACAASVATF